MKSLKKRSKKSKKQFGEKEFIRSVWKTMRDQARKSPSVGLLHERLEEGIRIVGLTGGIASGKSTVSRFLKEAQVPIIDADEIAQSVVRPGKPTYKAIVRSFGEGVLGALREIDRERLGEIVFADDAKRALLESITHPEILKEIVKRVRTLRKKKVPLVVIDAALLFESGLHRHMHKTIFVRIEPNTQLSRLMVRDRLPEAKAWQRILCQMPASQKEAQADFLIDNSGTKEETHNQVLALLSQLAKK